MLLLWYSATWVLFIIVNNFLQNLHLYTIADSSFSLAGNKPTWSRVLLLLLWGLSWLHFTFILSAIQLLFLWYPFFLRVFSNLDENDQEQDNLSQLPVSYVSTLKSVRGYSDRVPRVAKHLCRSWYSSGDWHYHTRLSCSSFTWDYHKQPWKNRLCVFIHSI